MKYFWIIIIVVLSSCSHTEWKNIIRSNAWLYEVELKGQYNLRADTLTNAEIQSVKNVWMRPEDRMALFEINHKQLFLTQKAKSSIPESRQNINCPYDYAYKDLKYLLYIYEKDRNLNYLFKKMKRNKSFLVVLDKMIYKNDNVYDSMVGIYTYKYLNIESNYADSLFPCK